MGFTSWNSPSNQSIVAVKQLYENNIGYKNVQQRLGTFKSERIQQTEAETTVSTINVADDALSKVLGPDRGHVRGFGFGVTCSKLSLLSQQDDMYKVLEKEYLKTKEEMVEMKTMKDEMIEMKALMLSYLKKHTEPSGELSNATASVLKRLNIPPTCPMPSPLVNEMESS
uniref:Transposase n=1 Tax=Cucumis melo TaxID=3656 RepID=A0A9I9DJF5_CUCME